MNTVSPLKKAFEDARSQNNIELILPVFKSAELFIAGKKIADDITPQFYLTGSPNSDRLSVTVSEFENAFSNIQNSVDLIKMSGEELLKVINPAFEIVVGYVDGGDLLTKEHLDWFRGLQQEKF